MSSSPPERVGLRERKKARTRQRIQDEALRLFTERGYGATTVEQIAEAAEVSPSTFFRYYPTKEDVVVWDEGDELLLALFRGDSGELPPLESVRATVHSFLAQVDSSVLDQAMTRIRLILSEPALRARMVEHQADMLNAVASNLAERAGRDPADLEARVFAGALIGAMGAVLLTWIEAGRQHDIGELLDRALAHLEAGLPL